MTNRPTVVLADDNHTVTDLTCALLSAAYKVLKVAVDGEDAIRWICELQPDFAILDISIPKLDGLTVAREVRRAGLRTRVIFLTLIEDEDYVRAARPIADGYVLKRRLSSDLLRALTSAAEGVFFCS